MINKIILGSVPVLATFAQVTDSGQWSYTIKLVHKKYLKLHNSI